MSEYKDYVLAKREISYRPELFVAPAFSHLKRDDLIVVEPEGMNQMATVIASITIDTKALEDVEFVLSATGTEKPKRVLSKVNYEILEYEEDESDD